MRVLFRLAVVPTVVIGDRHPHCRLMLTVVDKGQIRTIEHILEPTVLSSARFAVLAGELAAVRPIERLNLLQCWDAVDVI